MSVKRAIKSLGIQPRPVVNGIRDIGTFRANKKEFLRQAEGRKEWAIGEGWPCLTDRRESSGVAQGQYFHQDLYVAQQIFTASPGRHVDAGSRVDGLVAHLATFMPVEVLDIRDLRTSATNLSFSRRDLMQADPTFDGYTNSLSCLHTLEHFGLGRYGDPIDYDGHLRGWSNLTRMVATGGTFYFSVPISVRPRIEFDAHRLFSVPMVRDLVSEDFAVESVAAVDDDGELRTGLDLFDSSADGTFGIEYGCVILTLIKQ